uniref:Ig-like domain-containing protein n=1 Tax=Oryzias latipes TaxID=8090 RepID=A0A3B3HR96_ORYLA
MLLYLFLLLSHILGEFKNRDSSLLEAAASTHHLIHLMASFSPLFPGLTAGDTISPDQDQLTGTEGKSVTMKCNYQTTRTGLYLYWYKHDSDLRAPQFILWKGAKKFKEDRFDAELKDKSVPLKIQKLHVSDSAVYYCALRPTVTGNMKHDKQEFYVKIASAAEKDCCVLLCCEPNSVQKPATTIKDSLVFTRGCHT